MERAGGRASFCPDWANHPTNKASTPDSDCATDSLHIPIYAHTNMEAHNTHLLLRRDAQLYPGVLGIQSLLHRVRRKGETSRRQF